MLRVLLMTMILSQASAALAADPFRETLLSAERGFRIEGWKISHRELDLRTSAPWSVHKVTLRGGKQEGVDLVTVDNGNLRFSVVPTRGMSVLKVELGDLHLGWESPVKEIVHPQFIRLESRGGLGWLEGFNEWMVRCGLEFAGHPGKDKFINNVGDEAEMDLTLHGKIGNIPASEVEVVIDRDPPHRIRVRGRVEERMFYGPKFELWTEISTEPGSDSFRIEDKVTNHGAFDQEFQIIYHANYGRPLLEEGSRFVAPVKRITPFNTHAAKAVHSFADYSAPSKGFIEQVYCIHPHQDQQGRTTIQLQNASGNRAVSMTFSTEQLPYITLWKNTSAIKEGYVTGLEPGTGFPYNRRIERHFGRVPKLAPGQTREFRIDFALQTTPEQVRQTAEQIEKIQGGRSPQVDAEPVELPD